MGIGLCAMGVIGFVVGVWYGTRVPSDTIERFRHVEQKAYVRQQAFMDLERRTGA
jgi:hypothetical protein